MGSLPLHQLLFYSAKNWTGKIKFFTFIITNNIIYKAAYCWMATYI